MLFAFGKDRRSKTGPVLERRALSVSQTDDLNLSLVPDIQKKIKRISHIWNDIA